MTACSLVLLLQSCQHISRPHTAPLARLHSNSQCDSKQSPADMLALIECCAPELAVQPHSMRNDCSGMHSHAALRLLPTQQSWSVAAQLSHTKPMLLQTKYSAQTSHMTYLRRRVQPTPRGHTGPCQAATHTTCTPASGVHTPPGMVGLPSQNSVTNQDLTVRMLNRSSGGERQE